MARISIPFNLENKEQVDEKEPKETLSKKEIKAKEHLEEMSEITRHLSYNDINLLKKNRNEKEKEENKKIERQEEIEQKERHD